MRWRSARTAASWPLDARRTVRLWNVTSPANPQPLGQPLASSDSVLGGVNAVAFSPDGRIRRPATATGRCGCGT